ncbi:MAG: protein kinase [Cyanophyceae cyanobacterium]
MIESTLHQLIACSLMETPLLNNRYRILQPLARGGFGQTFLAVDTHMPSGRKCAIKQLQPAVQDPNMEQWVQASFQREAAILEQLGEGHGQIPRLYAYFAEAGDFYLVQEWIEGVTLQELVQQGSVPAGKVKAILGDILPVLDYVHSRHILHRDIKPDNIILRSADSKPVLIDFGAVKEAIATAVERGRTATIAVGTPGYMASEQAAGRPLYSSDLYSLGLTAIYLLTGKSPQELDTNPRTGAILWHKDAPQVDAHLATVIDRAIQFHPKDRFASAVEMREALYPAKTTPTVVVSPRTPLHRPPLKTAPVSSSRTTAVPPAQKTQTNWLIRLLPLFLLAAMGGIAFAVGFNWFSPQRQPVVSTPEPLEPSPPEPLLEEPVENEPAPPEAVPLPEPLPSIPEPEPLAPPASRQDNATVPTLATGVTQEQVLAALGEPTSNKQGYWEGSRAWLYRNVGPEQADLGLLFDTSTGRLRQTEVTFASSVDLATMQATLKQLLGGNAPTAASEGLRRIYERQTDMRSFEAGELEGMIRRNEFGRIYIGVWEADFH